MPISRQSFAFRAEIEPVIHLASGRGLYKYTILTEQHRERVYEGVAADLREALDSAVAHMRFLNESLAASTA